MANLYSSRCGKLIESLAVSLPTEVFQLCLQFGSASSYFSRRITAERAMGTMMVVIGLEVCKLSFQVSWSSESLLHYLRGN